MSTKSVKNQFLWIARLEGSSFLLLLFIAMPLKYIWDWDHAVKYIGWAHGILFVAYFVALLRIWTKEQWSFGKAFLAGVVSLLPFGTFWFEAKKL